MSKLTRYGGGNVSYVFSTLEELLLIPYVSSFKNIDGYKFRNFCLGDDLLVAVFESGFIWYVVGRLDSVIGLGLPQWDRGKYRIRLPDNNLVDISGDKVESSWTGFLQLKDGSVVKDFSPYSPFS